ncbi:hypothetical protein CROQUDRAFT_584372 [Cronartium quercuum f. sp. fusiforme G11]|uniref:Uncharacterized protein n=1 Tax=Cronartium quercuum f. sp. fusiforme G11 TaxID=708437 RepID=A0A9P6TAG4_9BASI|nr:hypothetical protein CROQUDRAFT_584372 [Cronartium quercuum f. sp. fusiforme G11]
MYSTTCKMVSQNLLRQAVALVVAGVVVSLHFSHCRMRHRLWCRKLLLPSVNKKRHQCSSNLHWEFRT